MKTNLMRDSLNALFSDHRHIIRFYLLASALLGLLAICLELIGVGSKVIVLGIAMLILPLNALIYALFQKRKRHIPIPPVPLEKEKNTGSNAHIQKEEQAVAPVIAGNYR